jgi:hypothetical protein
MSRAAWVALTFMEVFMIFDNPTVTKRFAITVTIVLTTAGSVHAQAPSDLTVSGILKVGPAPPSTDTCVGTPSHPCPAPRPDPNAARLQVGGDVRINGNELISGDTSFGAIRRQMINLFGSGFGIGVQDSGFYQRTDRDFFWYRGGQHSNASGDGGGGTELMHLGPGGLSFGASTRQMLNLFGTGYGIGVQDSGFYQRSDFGFFWYKGGQHSNAFGDGGSGGTQLMKLDPNGLTAAGRIITPVLEITGGNDVAEPFLMSQPDIPKGSVVVIDQEHTEQLTLSREAYDTRVAGVVSGANGINAGISLSRSDAPAGAQNVALSGRVYVLADATSNAIKPGDLLTTSDTPGHAMKVTDYTRAQGAVIGKAMSALKDGMGMVLVLVTLQ